MFRVRSPQDLGAAVIFTLVGAAGLWFGREYDTGTASSMGPGYMPMLLSWGLIIFGAIVGARALTLQGPAIEKIGWRTGFLVLGAVLVFAFLIRPAGLALAVFAVTVLAARASSEAKWMETLALGAVLAIFCVAIFISALRQSISVFGEG